MPNARHDAKAARWHHLQLTALTEAFCPGVARLLKPLPKPRRARRTVEFDAARFNAALDQAVSAEIARLSLPAAQGVTGLPAMGRAVPTALKRQDTRYHLLALLKAFCDAALPAGGLPQDEFGDVLDLPTLLRAGQELARQGQMAPKLLEKVNAGRAVDQRMGLAALQFFRTVLQRPRLTLQDIGGAESDRLRTVRRLERAIGIAQAELPRSVYEGLRNRAEETAGHAYIAIDVHVHYGWTGKQVDPHGMQRMSLTRTQRWRPLRLHSFGAQLTPTKFYECYQWTQVCEARLRVANAIAGGGVGPFFDIPVVRRLVPDKGIFCIEPVADLAPDLRRLLMVQGAGADTEPPLVEWQEKLLFNPADRDILVWYYPVHGLRVSFDAELLHHMTVNLGDSPGLVEESGAWRLDRTLMPREVLAVRFRMQGLDLRRLEKVGASGEWVAETAQP